jgi:membrane-associated phospholipid phosphatase
LSRPPKGLSVYSVDIPSESALTVGFFGLYFMVDVLVKPSYASSSACLHKTAGGFCDPADLSGFDRYAIGKDSKPWKTFSDVALISSLIIPVLYLGLESLVLPSDEPWGDFFSDFIVMAESIALSASVDTVLKFAFRRPRPVDYTSAGVNGNMETQLSLPSGHAALVSAATTVLTTTIFLRHPDSKVRYVVLVAGIAASLLTAFARVQAGEHFPTDAITGLVVGGVAGFAVPYLHRKRSPIMPSVAYDPTTGSTVFAISGHM